MLFFCIRLSVPEIFVRPVGAGKINCILIPVQRHGFALPGEIVFQIAFVNPVVPVIKDPSVNGISLLIDMCFDASVKLVLRLQCGYGISENSVVGNEQQDSSVLTVTKLRDFVFPTWRISTSLSTDGGTHCPGIVPGGLCASLMFTQKSYRPCQFQSS